MSLGTVVTTRSISTLIPTEFIGIDAQEQVSPDPGTVDGQFAPLMGVSEFGLYPHVRLGMTGSKSAGTVSAIKAELC